MFAIGRHVSKLSGFAPAIPTPFHEDGGVDWATLETYCHMHILEGANALVVATGAGEFPTLTPAERHRVVQIAVRVAQGQVPVVAGAGANGTAQAIDSVRAAETAGADAAVIVVPSYNRPTQAGLVAHFEAIAGATGLPIFLQDVPTRTACGLTDETVARLAETRTIIGLADAAGDPTRPTRLKRLAGESFRLLSCDDATALSYFLYGGDGCISAVANLAPGLCRNMFLRFKQGHTAAAQRMNAPILRLVGALAGDDPVPLKFALSLLGFMPERVRLPLVGLPPRSRDEIRSTVMQLCDQYRDYMLPLDRIAVRSA